MLAICETSRIIGEIAGFQFPFRVFRYLLRGVSIEKTPMLWIYLPCSYGSFGFLTAMGTSPGFGGDNGSRSHRVGQGHARKCSKICSNGSLKSEKSEWFGFFFQDSLDMYILMYIHIYMRYIYIYMYTYIYEWVILMILIDSLVSLFIDMNFKINNCHLACC